MPSVSGLKVYALIIKVGTCTVELLKLMVRHCKQDIFPIWNPGSNILTDDKWALIN